MTHRTDFDTRAREIVSTERCRNCRTIGDTCECEAEGGIRIAYPLSGDDLISAISSALKEAVEEAKLQARSECAQKFEDYYNQWVGVDDNRANAGRDAASAIRSRKETPDV